MYLSLSTSSTAGGVSFGKADILSYNRTVDLWHKMFDGSDVGLTNLSAFFLESDGTILLSFGGNTILPNVGTVNHADILRFTPTQLGDTTAGAFTLVLDGSDVGLDTYSESIDAVGRTADGQLFISTSGMFDALGQAGAQCDLFAFNAASLGDDTSGSWALYFDGSDVGLGESTYTAPYENVNGAWLDAATGSLYLTTAGEFTPYAGFGGDADDIFACIAATLGETTTCSYVFYWNGEDAGF